MEIGFRVSCTGVTHGEEGPPRFLGHPLRACRGRNTPPCVPPLAHIGSGTAVFQGRDPLDTYGIPKFSGLHVSRPTRSPDYTLPAPLPTPSQAWLPACRAQLWPDGFCTRWMT